MQYSVEWNWQKCIIYKFIIMLHDTRLYKGETTKLWIQHTYTQLLWYSLIVLIIWLMQSTQPWQRHGIFTATRVQISCCHNDMAYQYTRTTNTHHPIFQSTYNTLHHKLCMSSWLDRQTLIGWRENCQKNTQDLHNQVHFMACRESKCFHMPHGETEWPQAEQTYKMVSKWSLLPATC